MMREDCVSAYGWSANDRDGWHPRYYYAYYTTLGERSETGLLLETMLFVIIMICSLFANATIIMSIFRRKEMQTVTNCFIANLALADLIFVFSIPAIAVARASPTWNLGETMCKLLPYSQFVCGSVLMWTLAAISIDRVWCLATAPYRSGLTQKTAMILAGVSWIIAIIIFLPVPIFFREQDVQYNSTTGDPNQIPQLTNGTICTLVFPPSLNQNINSSLAFTLIMVIASCLLPMCILVINFIIIFRKLAGIQRKLEERFSITSEPNNFRNSIPIFGNIFLNSQRVSETPQNTNVKIQPSIGSFNRLMKHRKAVRILCFNIFAVLTMWLPISIVMFLIYRDGHRSDEQYFLSNQYFIWAVIIALMNTIVNPIIYGFLTENFRDTCLINRWISKHFCAKWFDLQSTRSHNNTSSNSKNISAANYCAENPVPVE